MQFSLLRLLIAVGLVAVWLAGARAFVMLDQAARSPSELLVAWMFGCLFSAFGAAGVAAFTVGIWWAAGEIEKRLKRKGE